MVFPLGIYPKMTSAKYPLEELKPRDAFAKMLVEEKKLVRKNMVEEGNKLKKSMDELKKQQSTLKKSISLCENKIKASTVAKGRETRNGKEEVAVLH